MSTHYEKEAVELGLSSDSTMPDKIVRNAETKNIINFVNYCYNNNEKESIKVLEIGSGNGYLMQQLTTQFQDSDIKFYAIDITKEFVQLAKSRNIPCEFYCGDVCALPFEDEIFDIIISERTIINILDPQQQLQAYKEVLRVMKRGSVGIFIEGFKSGLANLNLARSEFFFPPIKEPTFNNWYTDDHWKEILKLGFQEEVNKNYNVDPENFMSSHYFMTRFVHDILKPPNAPVRNTQFAKFFGSVLKPYGNYSPLQLKILKKELER